MVYVIAANNSLTLKFQDFDAAIEWLLRENDPLNDRLSKTKDKDPCISLLQKISAWLITVQQFVNVFFDRKSEMRRKSC